MPVSDEDYLRRAIRLAMQGRGRVEPNPMVGCVIVKQGRVIGEAYHGRFGGPHAEPIALAACTENCRGATMYVTLEPCCHTNKKTPPCTPRLIEAGIQRVVIGCLDPNPNVDGRGVAILRAAGITVDGPILEAQCKQLNAAFFKGTLHARPYVTLKWAESANGKVAGAGGRRSQISNDYAMRVVHEMRARSDTIMVGINTVLSDDPQLTVRNVEIFRPLTRVILDSNLRMPLESMLARTGAGEVIIFCSRGTFHDSPRVAELEALGLKVVPVRERSPGRLVLDDILFDLDDRGQHLLVEPGPTLAESFFCENLADRVWVIRSPHPIDEPTAPSAPRVPAHYIKTAEVDLRGDTFTEYLNPNSPVFFAAEPSADIARFME
ncbi:bifunctional diaminohydroxyphosphoribosylaminopyrimidine deaminase/5-amino-6-(5-phosphoribosylamino)uracil reductase RibD [Fontivita pretiosa]|uniref:bifunctional diaminohydroxyphosphoribosylaminopyrimidine deaminase/5-amino-6-(5-phosphoribosylamino)uracil reductase RibD n=1 Tax=Fontivita pretiosa TaxID=2989684 RepID=UPI003D1760F7